MQVRARAKLVILALAFSLGHALEYAEHDLAEWEMHEAYDGWGPMVGDDDHEDEAARDGRRLALWADHDDVPTNITGISQEVEDDWADDFAILKPIVEARGFNVAGASHLCELPAVYCTNGYRRRVPTYAGILMDDDWVGQEYQLVLTVPEEKKQSGDAVLDPALFNLKRVGYFQVYVNSGPMPAGLEALNRTKMVWLEGNFTHGFEGDLPDNFFTLKSRMFLMAGMGPAFTGHLPATIPMCDHLDYRVYFYRLQAFTGDISGLSACNKVTDVFEVFLNPFLGGNVWNAALGWDSLTNSINLWGSNFSGLIPFAETSTQDDDQDPWVVWCRKRAGSKLYFRISQQVGGPFPAGFNECAPGLGRIHVAGTGLTGNFPLNFSQSINLKEDGIKIYKNALTGPIPDIPSQVTIMDLHSNKWTGGIPASWLRNGVLETVDLSDCDMTGSLPDMPDSVKILKFNGNRFTGPAPQSWFENTNFEEIDLSGNQIAGAPIPWAWVNTDVHGNFDEAVFPTSFSAPPAWPLKKFIINNNPLGISVGFLIGLMTQYEVETLSAANCSLHGFAASDDFLAHTLDVRGGMSVRLSAVGLSALETVDLSGNNLTSFGYDRADGAASSCWQLQTWLDRLPALTSLNIENCPKLRVVHPQAFSLDTIDLRRTPSLEAPAVHPNATTCSAAFDENVATCAGEVAGMCFYRNPAVYYSVDERTECASMISQRRNLGISNVLISPELFAPSVLCRCVGDWAQNSQGVCVNASEIGNEIEEDVVAGEDDGAQLRVRLLLVIVVVVIVLLIGFCITIVWIVIRRRRRAQAAAKAAQQAQERASEAQKSLQTATATAAAATAALTNTTSGTATSSRAGGDSTDPPKDKNNEFTCTAVTEEIFKDMDLTEIVTIGLKEHWVIPKESIEFRDLAPVRSGGFGEVRRAAMLDSTDVAVKIPKKSGTGGEKKVKTGHAQTLLNEMRLFRRIRHPNIVLFHGVTAMRDGADPILCLVLEWIDSGDFGRYVKKRQSNGSFDRACVAYAHNTSKIIHEHKVLVDVARAMQYLHGQNPPIMHRDLKPGNILIELPEPPRAKVADFGLSTILNNEEESKKAGTLSYMAPEVAAQAPYSLPADVFSFGCVGTFCLTAVKPESGRQQAAAKQCITKTVLPPVISHVCFNCLHENPKDRFDFATIYDNLSGTASSTMASSTMEQTTTSTGYKTSSKKESSGSGSKPNERIMMSL